MAFTLVAILVLTALALGALVAGHFMGHVELYFLGVVVLLFTGLILLADGFERQSGHVLDRNETMTQGMQNDTDTIITEDLDFTFESVKNRWTNAFGLLLVVIAGGASMTYFRERRLDRRRRERGLDVEDDF